MDQAELRGTFTDKYGWSIFLGAARLGDSYTQIYNSPTRLGGGVGLNVLIDPRERIKVKLDLAYSQDSSGVYFMIGESF